VMNEKKGTKDVKRQASADFAAVARSWMRDDRATQFGAQVESWETVDQETKDAQAKLLRAPELLPERPIRDEWDIEYDKGKVKKVKVADVTVSGRQHFDRFYGSRKKFLAPGKRAHRTFKAGGAYGGRPFKKFNKPGRRDY